MKNFVGKIYERSGDYDYYHYVRFVAENQTEADKNLRRYAREWYTGVMYRDGDGWICPDGQYVEAYEATEVTEATYLELATIL